MSRPRTAVAFVMCVLLLTVGAVLIARGGDKPVSAAPPAPATSSASPEADASVAAEKEQERQQREKDALAQAQGAEPQHDDLDEVAPRDLAADEVATEFARVWLTGANATSQEAWLTELAPLTVPAVQEQLAQTPLEALPRTTLAGVTEDEGARTHTSHIYTAELVADPQMPELTGLTMRLAWDGSADRWRVVSYGPAQAPDVGAAP